MITAPTRLERGVYRRQKHGQQEFGARCDELTGDTKWVWGFQTAARARQDYQARRTAVRLARDAGAVTSPTKATLGDLRDDYLRSIEGKRISYRSKKLHLDWWAAAFKRQPVLTIRSVQIEDGMAALIKGGRSPSTANRYAETLRRMMRKMVSPFDRVVEIWKRVEFYDEPESLPVPLTDKEEHRLYSELSLQDALYARLDVVTGVRLAQLFTQRWEWLSWDQAIIHLPRFKRHPARILPIPQEGMAIYALLWEQQERPPEGWIFPVRRQTYVGAGKSLWKPGPIVLDRTTHINPHNWYTRNYRPAVARAKLREGVTFHTLRKTWASRLGASTPQPILQILAGWKSDVVKRYCVPFMEQMREAMERGAQMQSVEKVSRRSTRPTGQLVKILKSKTSRPRNSADRVSVS